MEAQRLLIAENNEDLQLALARRLQNFHYVRCCSTGTEALELLRKEKPSLLVLNMCLPELDGLTLLETIAAENIRPMVLALTTFRSDYLAASAERLGVAHILLKPSSLDHIVYHVLNMKEYLRTLPPRRTPERILQELLAPLGIHPQLRGYHILQEVIFLMAAEPVPPQSKALYLDSAKNCGTTYHAVETTIRRIIESHFQPETWQTYFPGAARHPSSRVFLLTMTRLFREAAE